MDWIRGGLTVGLLGLVWYLVDIGIRALNQPSTPLVLGGMWMLLGACWVTVYGLKKIWRGNT